MTENRKQITCVWLLLLCFTTSCSYLQKPIDAIKELTDKQETKELKVYFTKSKGKNIISFVSVKRKIDTDINVIEGSLRELFLGPTKSEELQGIMSEIPTGTRLIKVEESEDEVLVDVSPQYLTGGGAASMQLRYLQLYKTLKKIAEGKKIYLNIDGKTLKTIGGEGLEVTQPLSKINDYTLKYEKTEDVEP